MLNIGEAGSALGIGGELAVTMEISWFSEGWEKGQENAFKNPKTSEE